MTYEIQETYNGYILKSGSDKFVLNHSKLIDSKAPYYLKQVEPEENYITGLFENKNNKSKLHGKTKDGRRVVVVIGLTHATITIN